MNINEHLWSRIIHRSETGESRKEDDINLLDVDGFRDYLTNHYDLYPNYWNDAFSIEIYFNYLDEYITRITFHYAMNSTKSTICVISDGNANSAIKQVHLFSDEFIKKYDITLIENIFDKSDFAINKMMRNSDCIQFLDDYIEMCKNRENDESEYKYCGIIKK